MTELIPVVCMVIAMLFGVIIWVLNMPEEKEKKKYKSEEEMFKEYEKETKMGFIEKKLFYSGLNIKFPFLTSEWFMVISMIVGMAAAIVVYYKTENNLYTIGGFASGVALMFFILIGSAEITYRKAEKQLIKFANLIDNFSKGNNGDLISLLDSIAPYLDEPLYTVVSECVSEAQVTNDKEKTIERMVERIETPYFAEMINNLLIASKYEADYKSVVHAYRGILKDHSAMVQNKKSMIIGARTNIAILIGVSVIIIGMVKDMVTVPLLDALTGSPYGLAALAVCTVITIAILIMFISIGRSK